jgi:tetratricopeptide (TPR) repeat protein
MAPPRPSRIPRILLYVFLIASAGIAAYWNGLRAPFIWDDDPAIISNTTIRSVLPLSASLSPPLETAVAGRPIVNLSLALTYAVAGLDETAYHSGNLAILIASAILLFAIVRLTVIRLGHPQNAGAIALVSALVWAVHPLLSETVDYTTQRTESMMGLFLLLTMYAAIRGRESAGWLVASVLACAAGMATKESMAVAPLAILLYDRVFEFTSMRDALRARGGFYAALALTWVELGLLMLRWPRSTVGAAKVSPWTYLLNQAQMIVRYLGLSVWPHALVLDYGLPRSIGIGDVLPQALLLVAMLAGTIVALARWPAIGFLGAMFFLTLAPTSSVVPIASEVGAERRMYLPLAAVSVFAVTLGSLLLERLRARWSARSRALTVAAVAASVAVVSALGVRTMLRNREYTAPVSLWESSVARWPNGRARFSLATEYISAGRHDEAVAQLREAVNDYPDARAGLGAELVMQGRPAEAIGVLNVFIDDKPSLPNRIPARLLLGQALLTQGQIEAAASQFKAILDLDPSSRSANQGMGIVARIQAARFLEQGKVAPAEVEAREALRRNPGDAEAHNILGATLASQGQLPAAIQEFQETLRLSPQHKGATTNLARALAISQPQRHP